VTIDIKKGRYWDEGITLVDGCTPCSPGCDHCWSASLAHRFYREGEPGHESGLFTDDSGRFNGDVMIHPERIKRFKTCKPKVFSLWNDLFHKSVPPQFIDDVFSEMRFKGASHNTFLVLTKRPQNISRDYFNIMQHTIGNLYLGLTVCNQHEADEKIPIFLQVPGRKFLSIEPMLSDIILPFNGEFQDSDGCYYDDMRHNIKAVILGVETGPGARPMNSGGVRSIRDQCAAAGVPFFFKGWGKHLPSLKECFGNEFVSPYSSLATDVKRLLDGRLHDELPWRCHERD